MLILDWIDTLGLLPPDPASQDTNGDVDVLGLFAELAKRTIVLEAVAQLGNSIQRPAIIAGLKSWQRLVAFMELVSPALSLGLEDQQATGKVVELYLEWLLQPGSRPAAVRPEREQTFICLLLRHLSLLFQVRRTDVKGSVAQLQVSKQTEMCRQVLRACTSLAIRPDPLAPGTWKTMMLVLLGISDSLLRLPVLPPCQLADELTSDLLATVAEVWLRSQSLSAGLWKSLSTYYHRWCHRLAAVSQWTAISLALTQRLSRHLYGQGTEAVVYAVHGQPVTLEGLSHEFELFAWKQHLGLIAKPADLPPANCLRAVLGIELLLQVFYSVGQTQDPSSTPIEKFFPDGNTLLSLFGKWLFDAACMASAEHVESCAHAIGILCRLFSKQQFRGSFEAGYLNQFYHALDSSLQHQSLLVTVFICINSEDLLTARLPGLRILAPAFLRALLRLVPRPQVPLQLNIRMEDLRRACYKLIFTLLAYGSHFGPQTLRLDSAEPTNTYSDELMRVCGEDAFVFTAIDALISSLMVEEDAGNRRYLLNSLTAAALDAASKGPGMAHLLARILSDLLLRSNNASDPETATVALQSLAALREVDMLVDLVSQVIIPSLCEAIKPLSDGPLLTLATETMIGWATHVPAAALHPETLPRITRTLESIFRSEMPSCSLGQLALTRLLAGLGPLFTRSPLSLSSSLTEMDFIQDWSDISKRPQYFCLNESVVACLLESQDDSEKLVLILRTPTGRYVWQAAPDYADTSDEGLEEPRIPWKALQKLSLHSAEDDHYVPDEDLGPLYNDTAFSKGIESDPLRQKNLQLLDTLCRRQAAALEAHRHLDGPAHVATPHRPDAVPSLRGKLARLLLAHFGFLAPASCWLLQPIPWTPELPTELQSLDALPERDTMSISVFFVRSGQQNLTEILMERRVSEDFRQLIDALGWPVSNGSHGFLHLASELGTSLPYYCDADVEVVYHVAPFLRRPSDTNADGGERLVEAIGSLVAGNRVAIVWLEDSQELLSLPGKFGCPETVVWLCVIPLTGAGADGLYRIRIMVTAAPGSTAAFTFGPLLDGMVLRREALGPLLRATAISASLFCLYRLAEPSSQLLQPIAARAMHIRALARKYESAASGSQLESVYASVLVPPEAHDAEAKSAPRKKSLSRAASVVLEDEIRGPDVIVSPPGSREVLERSSGSVSGGMVSTL